MGVITNDLVVKRGNAVRGIFVVEDERGVPVPTVGDHISLIVKADYSDSVTNALITLKNQDAGGSDDEIKLLDASKSLYEFRITGAMNLIDIGEYWYAISVVKQNVVPPDPYTIIEGHYTVNDDAFFPQPK
jgi:hypothetical protein